MKNLFKILIPIFLLSFSFSENREDKKIRGWEYIGEKSQRDTVGCFDTVIYFGETYEVCDCEVVQYWDQVCVLKEFYEDGELLWEQSWSGPIRLGLWTKYYKNGKKWYEGHYNESVKVDDWTEWYSDGRLKQIETYINVTDSYVKKFTYWSNKKIESEQNYFLYPDVQRVNFLYKQITQHQLCFYLILKVHC